MNVLVIGCGGQDGYYAYRHCLTKGWKFYGLSDCKFQHVPEDKYVIGDICDSVLLADLMATFSPDIVINFAAISNISHQYIEQNIKIIVEGSTRLLESLRRPDIKVFLTGSGLQFQNDNVKRIDENTPFEGRDAYSVARIATSYLARYYRRRGFPVYTGYLFHHESRLRGQSNISQRILNSAKNGTTIQIGDPDVVKEWGYASEIVNGIFTLLGQEKVFEAVIGTGRGHRIQEWIELCFNNYDRDWREYVSVTPGYQPNFKSLVSNPAVINSLGWKHEMGLSGLLKEMATPGEGLQV